MKFNWYKRDKLVTEIDVNYDTKEVKIINHSDRWLDTAFGKNENPTFEDFKRFLESRCIPRTRDKLKWHLEALRVDRYDPLLIVEKTKGRMAGDFFTLVEEGYDYEEDIEAER